MTNPSDNNCASDNGLDNQSTGGIPHPLESTRLDIPRSIDSFRTELYQLLQIAHVSVAHLMVTIQQYLHDEDFLYNCSEQDFNEFMNINDSFFNICGEFVRQNTNLRAKTVYAINHTEPETPTR